MGFVHRRRRGAELFLLVLALAVGIGAYAAVGVGVEGEVPADILAYGGWLAGLVDRRPHHGPPRRAVRRPGAAPGGRRAQRARPRGHPPARPRLRGARRDNHDFAQPAAHLDDRRRGCCSSPRWSSCATTGCSPASPTPRAGRDRAAPAADGPRRRQDHQRRQDLDRRRPVQLPARRGRQGAAGHRVRRLPRAAPRRARAGRPPGAVRRPAARAGPRPDPRDVAGQPRHPGLPEGPRLQPAVLRPLPDHALRRHRATRLAGRRRRCCSWAAARWSTRSPTGSSASHVQNRINIWLDPIGLLRPVPRQRPARSRVCSAWPGAASSAAASAAAAPSGCRSPSPTSSSPRSARSSA